MRNKKRDNKALNLTQRFVVPEEGHDNLTLVNLTHVNATNESNMTQTADNNHSVARKEVMSELEIPAPCPLEAVLAVKCDG